MTDPCRDEIEALRNEILSIYNSLPLALYHYNPEVKTKRACEIAASLLSRLSEVERALEPFAKEADRYDPDEGDSDSIAWDSHLLIGALRRARAALTPQGE